MMQYQVSPIGSQAIGPDLWPTTPSWLNISDGSLIGRWLRFDSGLRAERVGKWPVGSYCCAGPGGVRLSVAGPKVAGTGTFHDAFERLRLDEGSS
jgi:hypothetical protein